MGSLWSKIAPYVYLLTAVLTVLVCRVGWFKINGQKRDGGIDEKYFAWRALDGGLLEDYHEQVTLVSYDSANRTAIACYDDHPEACGTMYDMVEGCGAWLNVVGEEDGELGNMTRVEPWNPNGTLYSDNPRGGAGTEGKWIMSITMGDILECAEHLPGRRSPWVTMGPSMDFTDDYPDFPEEFSKRSMSAVQELEVYFATLPHRGVLNEIAAGGAKLMHKHMGNDSIAQAKTLFHAFYTILDKSEKKHAAWSLVRRGSVSADRVINALHRHILATAFEEDRQWLDLLSNGAVMKAVAARAETGKASHPENEIMNWVFDKVHGPISKQSMIKKLRQRLPGHF